MSSLKVIRFLKSILQHVFEWSNTKLNMRTPYYPQPDVQSKTLNQCLKMYLRCLTYHNTKN